MSYNFPPSATFITASNIDCTQQGIVNLYTTNSTGRFIPLFVIIELKDVSGFVSVPTITVGTTQGSNLDILGSTTLTNVSSINNTIHFSTTNPSNSLDSSSDINLNISNSANSTTYTITLTVVGIYHP